jgi:SAM-dependent methyltransferase
VAEQLSGLDLRKLWRACGQEFSPEAWGKILEDYPVLMRRCEACGFVFFDPSLAGNAAFYQQLESPGYFSPVRAEFKRSLRFARGKGLKRILDVGCGDGIFLDLARAAGHETCGLELNEVAANKARAKGHTIYARLLDQLDRDQTSGGFNLISLFQVLEHVPNPVTIIRDAARLLEPGGYISVAVPSEEGVYRFSPWDPHQWPPHHLSRWRLADLRNLARAAGLSLAHGGRDPLLGTEIENLWKLHNRLAPILGRPTYPGGALPKLVALAYRKMGVKHLIPHWGSSIYGYLRKP